MSARAIRPTATLKDLENLPEHIKGEVIEGSLYTQPRPRAVHQNTGVSLSGDLFRVFQRGQGGPGGWWILPEPGIELPEAAEVSPDVAGWRKERMPQLPRDGAITVVPDWVCEILSPSKRRHNILIKRPFYARVGVAWLWMADTDGRTVSVSRLHEGQWLDVMTLGDETAARIPPFEAVELDVTQWWT